MHFFSGLKPRRDFPSLVLDDWRGRRRLSRGSLTLQNSRRSGFLKLAAAGETVLRAMKIARPENCRPGKLDAPLRRAKGRLFGRRPARKVKNAGRRREQ